MKIRTKLFLGLLGLMLATTSMSTFAQEANSIEGWWDIEVAKDGEVLPSWLEIRHSGNSTLVGRFVSSSGSARPVSEIKLNGEKFSFSIPPQWEEGKTDLEFEGSAEGDGLEGTILYPEGKTYNWVATRAPKLPNSKNPVWEEPRKLFNGNDLSGWHAEGENQWVVESGVLKSPEAGVNLITDETFMDFKLHVEFRYPKGSNSGIYLRGRYEVQITDSKGMEPSDIQFGGVYGFLLPNEMVAKEAGEWQSYDITMVGRRVTIVANGSTIISDQIIPGITGGALNSKEGEPGPFFIQGDHGAIELRNILVSTRLK
jgi:hypothetical protein